MNKSTQLIIGASILGIVAVLFFLPKSEAGKLKETEQAAAEPKKKTEVASRKSFDELKKKNKQSVVEPDTASKVTLQSEVASEKVADKLKKDKQLFYLID